MGGGSGATRTFQSLEVLPDRNRKAHFPVCNVFFFFSFFFFFLYMPGVFLFGWVQDDKNDKKKRERGVPVKTC